MSWFYHTSVNLFNYYDRKEKVVYLPIKKLKLARANERVFIYGNIKGKEGLLGWGRSMSAPIKASTIPKEKRVYCFDPLFYQYKVEIENLSVVPIIQKEDLMKFPSADQNLGIFTKHPKQLFWAYRFGNELDFYSKKSYELKNVPPNKAFYLILHELRELIFSFGRCNYKKLVKNKCNKCGIEVKDNYGRRFFELHEKNELSNNTNIKALTLKDHVPLCKNCHWLEHEAFLNNEDEKSK